MRTPDPGEPGDGTVGELIAGTGCSEHQGIELEHPRLLEGGPKPQVEHLEECVLQPEDGGRADLEALVLGALLGDRCRNVDLGVVGLGQQQRDDDDLLDARACELADDGVERRLGELEECRLDPQIRPQGADFVDESGDGLG